MEDIKSIKKKKKKRTKHKR